MIADGKRATTGTQSEPPPASSSASEPSQTNAETEMTTEVREATTGAVVLPFRTPQVTGDSLPETRLKVTGDSEAKTVSRVTGDSKSVTPSKAKPSARRVTGDSKQRKKATKRRADTPEKPSLQGYEFVRHGAGWNVFRVTYSEPLPGRSWKRKARQYETHLTDKDIKDGKDLLECLKAKFLNK